MTDLVCHTFYRDVVVDEPSEPVEVGKVGTEPALVTLERRWFRQVKLQCDSCDYGRFTADRWSKPFRISGPNEPLPTEWPESPCPRCGRKTP